MVDNRQAKRRTFPPFDEKSGLSPRDQALKRIDRLLSEQLITPFPEDGPETPDKIEPINLDEVMEAGRGAAEPARRPSSVSAGPGRLQSAQVIEPPKPRLSAFSVILQGSLLIFVLAWVFLLGVLIGRGHLLESGAGHELIVWIEEKAGWGTLPEPQIVADSSDGQTAPVQETAPAAVPAANTDPAGGITATAEEEEAEETYPVWNWPGWEPPTLEAVNEIEPLPAETRVASAARSVGLEADSITAGPTSWAAEPIPPASQSQPPAAGESEVQETVPEAQPQAEARPSIWSAPEPVATAEAPAAAPVEENYPPATEPVEEEEDDEIPASMSPLAPAPLDGPAPGMGKFAVQVALAFDEEEAQRRVGRLESQGFTAYFYKNPNGRYPVRVGHFATRQDADTAKIRLEQLGYSGPYVSSLSN